MKYAMTLILMFLFQEFVICQEAASHHIMVGYDISGSMDGTPGPGPINVENLYAWNAVLTELIFGNGFRTDEDLANIRKDFPNATLHLIQQNDEVKYPLLQSSDPLSFYTMGTHLTTVRYKQAIDRQQFEQLLPKSFRDLNDINSFLAKMELEYREHAKNDASVILVTVSDNQNDFGKIGIMDPSKQHSLDELRQLLHVEPVADFIFGNHVQIVVSKIKREALPNDIIEVIKNKKGDVMFSRSSSRKDADGKYHMEVSQGFMLKNASNVNPESIKNIFVTTSLTDIKGRVFESCTEHIEKVPAPIKPLEVSSSEAKSLLDGNGPKNISISIQYDYNGQRYYKDASYAAVGPRSQNIPNSVWAVLLVVAMALIGCLIKYLLKPSSKDYNINIVEKNSQKNARYIVKPGEEIQLFKGFGEGNRLRCFDINAMDHKIRRTEMERFELVCPDGNAQSIALGQEFPIMTGGKEFVLLISIAVKKKSKAPTNEVVGDNKPRKRTGLIN